MKMRIHGSYWALVLTVIALWSSTIASAEAGEIRRAARPVPGSYIVVLKDGVAWASTDRLTTQAPLTHAPLVAEVARELLRGRRPRSTRLFEHALKGFATRLSEADAAALAEDARVKYVEEDGIVRAADAEPAASWGLDRIDQRDRPVDRYYNYDQTGGNVHAYVLDTGIRATHVDFSGRIGNGFTTFDNGGTDDCNGHGTHVSGTLGGTKYGVAKAVTLHPVRVLDCNGNGWTSALIRAVDWVTANHIKPAVANMSLDSGTSSDALDEAVAGSIAAGVSYAVAAGNQSRSACSSSPQRVPAAVTVAATNWDDARDDYSNYGPCVDLYAPGGWILSAWIRTDTDAVRLSGTSMATPHVAGAMALYLETFPNAPPAAVARAIVDHATPDRLTDNGGWGWSDALGPNLLLYSPFAVEEDGSPFADPGGPYRGVRNQPVLFDGTRSGDPDGDPLSYQWDFGDGATAEGPTPSHAYSALGTYTITLVVHDGTMTSDPATTTVTITNVAPSVVLTSPSGGAVFNAPAVVDLAAEADDDGSIALVEFYAGPDKIGEDATRPYGFTWVGVAPGRYDLTAHATDDSGATTTSSAAPILVNEPGAEAPRFRFSCQSLNLAVRPGGTAASICHVFPEDDGFGFRGTVDLSCEHLPPGESCNFSPNPVVVTSDLGVTTTAELAVPASAAPGIRAITLRARSGELQIARQLELHVLSGGPVACENGRAGEYPCRDVDQVAHFPLSEIGGKGALAWNVSGWTDPQTGREYAILGHTNGTAFFDVTYAEDIRYLGILPAHAGGNGTRTPRVYKDHLYVASYGGSSLEGYGLQIFDLRELRDVTSPPATFSETGHYDFHQAADLAINDETGFGYAVGSDVGNVSHPCAYGLEFLSLQDPAQPVSVGCFGDQVVDDVTRNQASDAQCVVYRGPDVRYRGREVCFVSNVDRISIADVQDKSAPRLIANTLGQHGESPDVVQGRLTEDHRYFLQSDGNDEFIHDHNTRTYVWDMADLAAPKLVGHYDGPTPASEARAGLEVEGNEAYLANDPAGLRILSLSRVAEGTLDEIAYFDTRPSHDRRGSDGVRSVYSLHTNGLVTVADFGLGLFVLRPTACLAPATPVLRLPVDGATDQPASPSLDWDDVGAEVSSFEVEIATESKFENVIRSATSIDTSGWKVDPKLDAYGTYWWRVRALNRCGSGAWSAGASFTTLPNRPPVLEPILDKTVRENELLSFSVAASDLDGDAVQYAASGLPAGASFDAATRVFSWRPSFAQAGPYPGIGFEVSDGHGGSDSEVITIAVINVNRPPVAVPGGPYSGVRGQPIQLEGSGSYDRDRDPLSFQWDFGDGSTGTGARPTHAYSALGTYKVTLVVNDGTVSSAPATTSVTIENLAPSVTLTSPAGGAMFTAPAEVELAASAHDPEGSIALVEFFAGARKIGEDAASPYAVTWTGVPAGSYALTTRATDDRGAVTASPAVTVTVEARVGPLADAYVSDAGFNANRNFGADGSLLVKKGPPSRLGSNLWSYLKFETSAAPSVRKARLRLFGTLNTVRALTPVSVLTSVYPVIDTSWDEREITWRDKPPTGATPLATVRIDGTIRGIVGPRWYEWDVTEYLQQEKAAGRHVVSLALRNETDSSAYDSFRSRDANASRPELVITP